MLAGLDQDLISNLIQQQQQQRLDFYPKQDLSFPLVAVAVTTKEMATAAVTTTTRVVMVAKNQTMMTAVAKVAIPLAVQHRRRHRRPCRMPLHPRPN